jgi:hypothetical protein
MRRRVLYGGSWVCHVVAAIALNLAACAGLGAQSISASLPNAPMPTTSAHFPSDVFLGGLTWFRDCKVRRAPALTARAATE